MQIVQPEDELESNSLWFDLFKPGVSTSSSKTGGGYRGSVGKELSVLQTGQGFEERKRRQQRSGWTHLGA